MLTFSKRNFIIVSIVTLLTIASDQISKDLIRAYFVEGEVRPVIPDFFNLTLTYNRGAAFGLWSNLPNVWREIVLAVTICLALLVIAFFLTRAYYQNALSQIALAGILGGAVGNIIDRLRFGGVVDFLDVYAGSYHWPAFNIADSAICVGVVLLIAFAPKEQSQPDPVVQP
jgi:signal peptidase II